MHVSAFGATASSCPAPTCFRARAARGPAGHARGRPPSTPRALRRRRAPRLAKTACPRSAEIAAERSGRLVTVLRSRGRRQPYVLQHFELRDEYPVPGGGEHWVSTVHSGDAVDSIDATGILVRSRRAGERRIRSRWPTQTIPLSRAAAGAASANLLDTLTLFVHARGRATTRSRRHEIAATYGVEPFRPLATRRLRGAALAAEPFALGPRAGLLRGDRCARPKGIARHRDAPGGLVAPRARPSARTQPSAVQRRGALVRFRLCRLDADRSYTLFLGRQPEVPAGAVVRSLPLDLRDPCRSRRSRATSSRVPFPPPRRHARAEAEDGAAARDVRRRRRVGGNRRSPPGAHAVAVRLPGEGHRRLLPPLRAGAPRPRRRRFRRSPTRLASLPASTSSPRDGADLRPARRRPPDLPRPGGPAGLYRVQSTGLLATVGTLRTPHRHVARARRRRTASAATSSSAVPARGRLPGDGGRRRAGLRGHLGLERSTTRVADGGDLRTAPRRGSPSPAARPWPTASRSRTRDASACGAWASSAASGAAWRTSDGWPLVTPGSAADLTRDFEPGDVPLHSCCRRRPRRARVTLLEPVAPPLQREGHGPHRLPLARVVEHVWLEPAAGGERVPDRGNRPSRPGPGRAHARRARCRAVVSGRPRAVTTLASVPPGRGWSGELRPGRYRLEVVSSRRNNRGRLPGRRAAGRAGRGPLTRTVSVPADARGLGRRRAAGGAWLLRASDVRARLDDAEERFWPRATTGRMTGTS